MNTPRSPRRSSSRSTVAIVKGRRQSSKEYDKRRSLFHGVPSYAAANATPIFEDADEALKERVVDRERDEASRLLVMGGMKSNRFSAALSDKEAREVWGNMQFFTFEAGESIVRQGNHGHYFFVCHDGELEVVVDDKIVNTLKTGEAFGAIALLYHCPRTATVRAKVQSSVWGADGELFRNVMMENARSKLEENRRYLDNVRLFDGLSSQQKERIGEQAIRNETFEEGDRVVSEGEVWQSIYFVKNGNLREWKGGTVDAEGKPSGAVEGSQLATGDTFGEKDALHNRGKLQWSTTVIADSHSELVSIGVPQLKEVLGEDFVGCLEQCFMLKVLKQVQALNHLSLAHRVKITQAMKVKDHPAGDEIDDDLRLGIVMNGDLSGERGGDPVMLRRGQWWEDEDLADLGASGRGYTAPLSPGSPSSPGKRRAMTKQEPPCELVAGPAGARLAVLSKEDLLEALQELGLSTSSMDSEEVIDYMRKMLLAKKVPIFRDLSEEQVDGLVDALELKRYTKGAKVFKQGEPGNTFFIVARGEVRVSINGNLVRTLGKGACFGERALLFDEQRTATVEVSSSEAELWCVDREAFTEVVTESMRAELVNRVELQDTSIELKELRHVRFIGKGAFGSVRLVEHKHRKGIRYALKRIRKEEEDEDDDSASRRNRTRSLESTPSCPATSRSSCSKKLVVPPEAQQECDLLASMDHPFILKLVRTFETEKSIYLLTELVTGGQLYEQTHDRMGILSRKQAQFYIASLVCILEAVHGANVIYRDLKPENVMLDAAGFLKLVDFGLSKRLSEGVSRTYTAVGTVLYMAPEIIRGHGYGFEVDMWSLGIMFYELVCGMLPFGNSAEDEEDGELDVLASVLQDELTFPSRYNDNVGKKLIQGLLCKQAESRTGCGVTGWEEIKEHKFFKAGLEGNIFNKILGREIEPPVVPSTEQYSDEKELNAIVTVSDAEELATDSPADVVRERVMSAFKRFDIKGDGALDTAELRKLLQLLDPVSFAGDGADKLLSAVDKDNNGNVKLETFLVWVAGDQSASATDFRKAVKLDMRA